MAYRFLLPLLFIPLLCTCGRAPENDATEEVDVITDYAPPAATGYDAPTQYTSKRLVWADEFGGETLDTTAWNHDLGSKYNGWGNNELQYYTRANTSLVDGKLVITARRQEYAKMDYTSSRITTKGKQEFKFGRIDMRAALPQGQGIWPALWMLGTGHGSGTPWPLCGEIDIMEFLGHKTDSIYGTVHFKSQKGHGFDSGKVAAEAGNDYLNAFHVYSIDWSPGRIEWLIDGVTYHVVEREATNAAPWPFDEAFYFLINLAVGGNWPGNPDDTTTFPQRFYVDYVRVYQMAENRR